MTNILVTYASKHGATAEIAQSIARVLKAFKFDVTARRVENIDDISDYDVVILGAALYLGEWIPQAVEFLNIYQSELKNKAVWLFASGPTGAGDSLDLLEGNFVPDEMQPLIDNIAPQEVKLFKGKIDLRRLPPEQRKIVKGANVPRGDYRDWDSIRNWAEDIARALSTTAIVKARENSMMLLED